MEHLILAVASNADIAQNILTGALALLRSLFYFVIAIFVLVSIHEFGHFIAGRIFGMRVPVFSVGMGQRVFGWNKLDGFTFGSLNPATEIQLTNNTDYRLSAVPMGGYARIEGMIDESTTELPAEVQPWEFRAKPWWQKTIVILAGVIMNTLLAWAVFTGMEYSAGMDRMMTTTVGAVEPKSQSAQNSVQPGDKIVAIDGKSFDSWGDIEEDAALHHIGHDFTITYSRAGQNFNVIYRTGAMKDPADIDEAVGLSPLGTTPPMVAEVVKKMPAEKAGLKEGDIITRINGDSIRSVTALTARITANANRPISIDILRDKKPMTLSATPNADGHIGIVQVPGEYKGPIQHTNYTLLGSIGAGWRKLVLVARLTVDMVGKIFTGKLAVSSALGGPVKIAQMASKSAANGAGQFISFIGLLSLSLAMLNVLPIPALDGGHLIIILIEAAIGHELSQTIKMRFQQVGVALLLSLMVFMVINDIRSL